MEALLMVKKGKPNFDMAIKQVKLFMPPDVQHIYIDAIDQCKDYCKKYFLIQLK